MQNDPDPQGQAALMVCESLLLLLIEKGVVGREDVLDVFTGLIEVKHEIGDVTERREASAASIVLLQTIAQSIAAAALGVP